MRRILVSCLAGVTLFPAAAAFADEYCLTGLQPGQFPGVDMTGKICIFRSFEECKETAVIYGKPAEACQTKASLQASEPR